MIALLLFANALAKPAAQNAIAVRLFESKCTLSGPASKVTKDELSAIHSVSPEQVFMIRSQAQARSAVEKLKQPKKIPHELENYLNLARAHAQKMSTFIDAATSARSSKSVDPLLKAIQVPAKNQTEFAAIAQKAAQGETLESLCEEYEELIGSAPEEEFHRVIRRMKVKYNCVFEQGAD